MEYEIVVGLEVHAELNTKTKIYCGCKNAFGNEVNTNCCPVCLGLPGALPTLNKTVVDYAIKMGHALNCKINRISKQDRKNYFYPDTPKAFQISQFDVPLCENGYIDAIIDENGNTKRFGVTRIHIEEDAGKLIHDDCFEGSLVDFNRSGVPLIEIVSEPDMRSSADAKAYLDTIKSILEYIGISDCKMQEGSIRCDVNVSVMPKGSDTFGTRVEMKNVNSFSGIVRAIEYESKRQIELIEDGGTVSQETRRWDDLKGESFLLRTKEDAQDYRYFPEPDLLTISVSEDEVEKLKNSLPELPNKRISRYMSDYKLPLFDANLLMENRDKAVLFEECMETKQCQPKSITNWILGDVSRILNEKNITLKDTKLNAKNLIDMIALIESGKISNASGKIIIEEIMFEDKSPLNIVKEKGLMQISDSSALEELVRGVLAQNEKAVVDFKNGKTNVVGFLVGQCMKLSKGQGNPNVLKEIMLKELEK
ncbi:MAG: Asp-tRNA(Asn)/Glu-tRNA(Gln) amidotransferase subunit GatB [Oscillospiraceae bacterium]